MSDQPHPGGHPRAIQPGGEVEQRLIQALEAGAPIAVACGYAGVSPSTYYKHCNEDSGFSDRATRARMSAAIRNLALIQKAAADDWRAASEALKLMFPEHFGKNRIEVTGDEGGPVKIAPEVSPDFVADVLRRLGEPGGEPAPEGPA